LGELTVATTILLVLGRVHARVIRDDHDQPAIDAGERGVDERVRGDVEADVLHGHEGAAAGVRHAERLFIGDLLIGGPAGRDMRPCCAASRMYSKISVAGVPG